MSAIDLDELERLHKAATPEPWEVQKDGLGNDMDVSPRHRHGSFEVDNQECADCRVTVAARNALPALIARIRELEAEEEMARLNWQECLKRIAALEGALRGYVEGHAYAADNPMQKGECRCRLCKGAIAALEGK